MQYRLQWPFISFPFPPPPPFTKSIFSRHSGGGIHFFATGCTSTMDAAWVHWGTAARCLRAAPCGPLRWEICKTKVRLVLQEAPHVVTPKQEVRLPLKPCQPWVSTTGIVERFLYMGQEGDKTLILQSLLRFLVHSPAPDLYSVFPGFGQSILCAAIATDAHISASRWQFQEGGLKMSVQQSLHPLDISEMLCLAGISSCRLDIAGWHGASWSQDRANRQLPYQ